MRDKDFIHEELFNDILESMGHSTSIGEDRKELVIHILHDVLDKYNSLSDASDDITESNCSTNEDESDSGNVMEDDLESSIDPELWDVSSSDSSDVEFLNLPACEVMKKI